MSIIDALLAEWDHESATTRSLLELVPEAESDWKPHEKSFSLGDLAMHLANIPTWGATILVRSEVDLASPEPKDAISDRKFESTATLLDIFDENVSIFRRALAGRPEEAMAVPWTLKQGGQEVFTMPRGEVLRSWVFNHTIHHRGQMSLYLRLHDVPLPQIYGPTADTGM